jgi:hypothetical protein
VTLQVSDFNTATSNGVVARFLRAVRASWQSTSATRVVSLALFAALIAWVLLVFRDYGISNDEPVQHTYGQLLWSWYRSGFTDDGAFHYINLYLYGGLFDLIAAGLDHHVPLDTFELRHLLSASFGLVGIFGAWNLARLLAGEKAGIVASLLLALTGMYGGAMFTHTKDVPFAAAMVWSLYFITVIARRMPELPYWRTVIGLGVAVGCAMGLRVGGVFAGLYLALTLLAGTALLGEWHRFPRLVLRLVPAGLIAFVIMAVTWPWSVLPPTNLLTAMGTFSNFAFDLSTLINGQEVPIDQVPATYMSEYLLIKLPEITLAGILAALAFAVAGLIGGTRGAGAKGAWHGIWRRRLVAHLPVALALIVPVVFTLLDRPPLYNGIRHFLFVIPAATVVASIGLCALWRWSMRRSALLGLGFATVAGGLFALNAVNFVELHPYEYVGYNQLVGGLKGATGRFEGDYWSDSLREAALDLRYGVEHSGKPPAKPYEVAVCAEPLQISTYLGPSFKVTDEWDDADFLITATNIGCDNLVPGMTYRTISRKGVPLAMVVDLRAKHENEDLIQPLPWDDDDNPDTPAVSFNGPGSMTVAQKKP